MTRLTLALCILLCSACSTVTAARETGPCAGAKSSTRLQAELASILADMEAGQQRLDRLIADGLESKSAQP